MTPYEAATQIEAAFPDRPFLIVDICRNGRGLFDVYAGKATRRLRCIVKDAPTLEGAKRRAIVALNEED